MHTGNMPLPPAPKLSLSDSDRKQLLEISCHRSTPRGIVLRVDILLGAAEGIANHVLARNLSTSLPTVLLWRRRFDGGGLAAVLEDRPRSGRPKQISTEQEEAMVNATMKTPRRMPRIGSVAGHGGEPAGQPRYRPADLEEAQTAAPSGGVLQVQ